MIRKQKRRARGVVCLYLFWCFGVFPDCLCVLLLVSCLSWENNTKPDASAHILSGLFLRNSLTRSLELRVWECLNSHQTMEHAVPVVQRKVFRITVEGLARESFRLRMYETRFS